MRLLSLLTMCGVLLMAGSGRAQTVPHTEAETLAGKPIVLPDALAGKTAILVVGFSHESSKPCGEWTKRIEAAYGKDPRVAVHEVAVLEDVPRFVRGMVTGGIKKGMSPEEQSRFVVIYKGEAEWKKVLGFVAGGEAYVAVVGTNGAIEWATHGKVDDGFAALQKQMEGLVK